MTKPMKALMALLLLACVCTVYGREKGARKKDVCTQGFAAVEVFIEFRGCKKSAQQGPRGMLRELLHSLPNNVTVNSLRHVFTNYCSTLMPRMRDCFESNIQNCTADQQRSLMAIAQETGYFCQPNSNNISPQTEHILTKLSDVDLAENPSCFNFDGRNMDIICHNRSLVAIGLPSGNFSLLENFTMEELASKIEVFLRTMVECIVTQIRDDPNRCQQWRGLALRVAGDYTIWPVLGNKMTFTNEEIDSMFEWDSPAKREDTGGLEDFFQLTEEWP